jgi:hypothetical protein
MKGFAKNIDALVFELVEVGARHSGCCGEARRS